MRGGTILLKYSFAGVNKHLLMCLSTLYVSWVIEVPLDNI